MNSFTISVKHLGMLKFVNDKIVQLYIEKKECFQDHETASLRSKIV